MKYISKLDVGTSNNFKDFRTNAEVDKIRGAATRILHLGPPN